jgi:hypothetical protein
VGSSATLQTFDDPTALITRIGELVIEGRQFAVAQAVDGRWQLASGGAAFGPVPEKKENK